MEAAVAGERYGRQQWQENGRRQCLKEHTKWQENGRRSGRRTGGDSGMRTGGGSGRRTGGGSGRRTVRQATVSEGR